MLKDLVVAWMKIVFVLHVEVVVTGLHDKNDIYELFRLCGTDIFFVYKFYAFSPVLFCED